MFDSTLAKYTKDYFFYNMNSQMTFVKIYRRLKNHFDTKVNYRQYLTDWNMITFDNIGKSKDGERKEPPEILQMMLNKLQLYQRVFGPYYANETQFVSNTICICQRINEFVFVLYRPPERFEKLCSIFHLSLEIVR